MFSFKAAAFDLDGTILDTSEGVLGSVAYTVEQFGYPPLKDEVLRSFIGPPIFDSFERTFGISRERSEEMVDVFRERYLNWGLFRAVPYDGIFDLFRLLSEEGIKPAVATYKLEKYAAELMVHFGFDKYTDIIFGSDGANTFTKAEIIGRAVRAAGVSDPAQAVMIGDSDNDAIGAQGAGTAFLGVTYGFGFSSAEDVGRFPNIGTAGSVSEAAEILTGKCL